MTYWSVLHLMELAFEIWHCPRFFYTRIIIPSLKKPTHDPSIPNNYRSVVVSTRFSKMLEMFVLGVWISWQYLCHEMLYLIVLRKDHQSLLVHLMQIPHSVLFDKCIGILPDVCWQLLYFWYHKLTVQIRWNNVLSDIIRVERDTRQGSLSSPFLFTIFYQDMIVELSNTIGDLHR